MPTSLLNNSMILDFDGSMAYVAKGSELRIANCLTAFGSDAKVKELMASLDDDSEFWFDDDDWRSAYRPYNVKNGILYIPITGSLTNSLTVTTPWMTGYPYVQKAFERGFADVSVKNIVMSINSPGGLAAGCFDSVDAVYDLKQASGTPVYAMVAENAYSAAYAWASLADQIWVTRTGGVGSIGVYRMHFDLSGMMTNAGVKITFVSAPEGGEKTSGNPYESLDEDTRKQWQSEVEETYDLFVSTIARNRTVLDDAKIRATKARAMNASAAILTGLADKIGNMEAVNTAIISLSEGSMIMTTYTQEQLDAAVADATKTATATARAEGAKTERERIGKILGSEASVDRPKMSAHLALNTEMSVADAEALLAVAAKESAVATPAVPAAVPDPNAGTAAATFDKAMSGTLNPNISADDPKGGPDKTSSVVELIRKSGMSGFRKTAK